MVCQYANNEQAFEDAGYSFEKGLMLGGRTGSGKTELILTYYDFITLQQEQPIAFHTCQQVVDAFLKVDPHTGKPFGFYGVQKYTALINPAEKIFDDLGVEETTVQNYGNKIAMMPYVFSKRYENRHKCGKT